MIKTGIYKISNKKDGKIYIGQAKDIDIRWKTHKRTKYPEDQYSYEILIECDIISLNFWEIAWITSENACDPAVGYNKTLGGTSLKTIIPSDEVKAKIGAAHKGKVASEETKAKISASNKIRIASTETRAKMSAAKKGKKLSDEHKVKISASNIGKKHTEETKLKISILGKERKFSDEHKTNIAKSNLEKKSKACIVNGTCYTSVKQAALALGIKYTTLKARLQRRNGWPDGISGYYIDEKLDEQGTFNA